jgi:signal transduction histidine kinase
MTQKQICQAKKRPVLGLLVLFLSLFSGQVLSAVAANNTLTNAADILSLSAKEASSNIPVSVKGIVTAAETSWEGEFFVQDASGGIFVVSHDIKRQPAPGDVVAISGVSRPGSYAPTISQPHFKILGSAPLPEAKPVTIERLMSGDEDSQRVEISGIVRTAQMSGNMLAVELVSGGYRLRAFAPVGTNVDLQSLVGARLLLRGTAAVAFNASLRHFITVALFVPQPADFMIEEPSASDPFNEPVTPLNGIAQYRRDSSPGNRVHVKGVVTYQRQGDDLFLQDGSGGLQVKTTQPLAVAPGDIVEAVGFPAVANFLPVLEDAIFRKTTEPRTNLQPQSVTTGSLLKGLHHASYITLKGQLMERLVNNINQTSNGPNVRTTLVLQDTNFFFTAEKDTAEANSFLAAIPLGSLVEASGICLLESGDDGKTKSMRLLLPTSHDIRIIKKASWLTPAHLLTSLAVVLVILLVAISWTVMVSKNNVVLKSLVQAKEAAQRELQQTHDQLEVKVKERTAQLKVEMTARKESELQFRAVLTERTRLAQELHDTLEQTMTGIALQLDMVANLFTRSADSARHHLKLARNLMRQSQVDLRRSVWALRSRAAEQFNLTNALGTTCRQIAGGAGIRVEIETVGEIYSLSEIAEENLLRIGQEAVTNVVKHSGATLAKIELVFGPQKVALQITDNGKGFIPEMRAGPKDGHFGLLGITERTERLGGQVQITSAPGSGVSIKVEIPAGSPDRQLADELK